MPLTKDKSVLQNFNEASKLEWLETDGLGGFAGSTISGCNTRRYHGLLTAALEPPTGRMALVSKLDETIIAGEERYELGCNNYGDVISPNGNRYLESFIKNLFPEFIYEAGGVRLKKSIAMRHGENTTMILYEVLYAVKEFVLELLPLFSVRDYHSLMHQNAAVRKTADYENHQLRYQAYDGTPLIYISVPNAVYTTEPNWYLHFNYEMEKFRGLDFTEDLFTPGKLSVILRQGDVLGIMISTENPEEKNCEQLFEKEKQRREDLLKKLPGDEMVRMLALAADQFIVKRDGLLKTVIAGYHWFTDWGRDTMIALPGLCLTEGRFDDAKKILSAFGNSVSMGMLPNRFNDHGQTPEYNNVDATLWYFLAVYRYLHASKNEQYVLKELLPVLKDIIEWHYKGTRYNIHVDDDELLFAGEPGVQLTWMDAKVDDWVVTPRTGKAVEVNALWYNALCIYSELLKLNGEKKSAKEFNAKSRLVKTNFDKLFWNSDKGYLYDVVNGAQKDDTLRPNQVFAISTCFPVIKGLKARKIMKLITEKLYTPAGLRSLATDDYSYKAHYHGDQLQRDGAYHQGTVWSWLLGPYIDALILARGKTGQVEAMEIIKNFRYHMEEVCIGTVSEIFEGDPPYAPRGCVAQAWSVAEILRVMMQYKLYKSTGNKKARVVKKHRDGK